MLRAAKPELLQNELSAAEEAAALALIQLTFRRAADPVSAPSLGFLLLDIKKSRQEGGVCLDAEAAKPPSCAVH